MAPADEGVSERERVLEAEVETLRAELARLRHGDSSPVTLPDASPWMGSTVAPDEFGALFAALGSVFPIGVFRTKPDGTLAHTDPMLQQIFGLQANEFQEFGWLRCVHPDDLSRVKQHWQTGVGQGTSTSLEFRIFRPGSETPANLVARNIPQHD